MTNRDPFRNYDAWLQTDPSMDDYDEDECEDEQQGLTQEQQAELRTAVDAATKRLDEYEAKLKAPPLQLDDMNLPPGNFNWSGGEAGEWIAEQCGCCEGAAAWSQYACATSIIRQDGVLTIELHTVDPNGNWGIDHDYIDAEDTQDQLRSILDQMQMQTMNYFRGWLSYYEWVAEHHEDPLNNWMKPPQDWFKAAIEGINKSL